MSLDDLFPSNDLNELFQLMDSKEHWLLLLVDFLPVAAIVEALAKIMSKPPKSYGIKGLPPVIVLPKKDISSKTLASIMSTAGGGPIPEEVLMRMLGDRDVILCAEPKSLELGVAAMERFIKLHRSWKTERHGIQLFFITDRLYKQDYEKAIDFLIWLLAGIVCYTANDNKTDVEVVTTLAEQIWNGASGAGKEKAQETAKALQTAGPHMEASMRVLEVVAKDLEEKDRAISVLQMWIKNNVHPAEGADWAASNLGLYMTLMGEENFNGRIAEVSEKILIRIRDKTFATNLWVKQRTSVPLEKLARGLDEGKKIEETTEKPPKRR
ncbi:MAG: hypothetical protein ACE5FB_01340 [Candidatus Binatia bacterium]